jgi:hypothetical protein
MEFSHYQVCQISNNANKLFSIEDIMNCIEIWRREHVQIVLNLLSEVFGDIDIAELDVQLASDNDMDDTIDPEWVDIRDDSSTNVLLLNNYDSDFQDVSHEMSASDASINNSLDTSHEIANIASEVSLAINTDGMEI